MVTSKEAPAAAKQTGATDESATDSLQANDTTPSRLLGDYPPIGTLEQAALMLQIPTSTTRQMCRDGRMHAFKCGTQWRIPRAWLEEFVNKGGHHELH